MYLFKKINCQYPWLRITPCLLCCWVLHLINFLSHLHSSQTKQRMLYIIKVSIPLLQRVKIHIEKNRLQKKYNFFLVTISFINHHCTILTWVDQADRRGRLEHRVHIDSAFYNPTKTTIQPGTRGPANDLLAILIITSFKSTPFHGRYLLFGSFTQLHVFIDNNKV